MNLVLDPFSSLWWMIPWGKVERAHRQEIAATLTRLLDALAAVDSNCDGPKSLVANMFLNEAATFSSQVRLATSQSRRDMEPIADGLFKLGRKMTEHGLTAAESRDLADALRAAIEQVQREG